MIVLDEHLQTTGFADAIRQWYVGSVVNVLDLRPGTVIKDEAIPRLLAAHNQPVFVTINAADFWLRLPVLGGCCVVCFALTTSQTMQIPDLLRRLLRHAEFSTKSRRAGKMVRVTMNGGVFFYSAADGTISTIELL